MPMQNKGSLNGTSPILKPFPVKEAETIVAGAIVVVASNVILNAADAAAAGTVVGVSAQAVADAAAAGADEILVDVNPATVYRMKYEGVGTVAVFGTYDLGANGYTFDSADTTGGFIKVVGSIDTTNKYADVVLINRAFVMG